MRFASPGKRICFGRVCPFGRLQKCILQAPKNAFSCFLKVVEKFGWIRDRSGSCRPEQGKSNVWELRTGIPGVLQRISGQSLGLGTPGHLTAADTAYVKQGPQPHWGIVCQSILSGKVTKCILRAPVNAFVVGECVRLGACRSAFCRRPKTHFLFPQGRSKIWMESSS